MRIGVVSFTAAGARLCKRIVGQWNETGQRADGYIKEKYHRGSDGEYIHVLIEKISLWTKEQFEVVDGIVFIGAAGIAVRAIAPFLKDKFLDPAVVVLDEKGTYAISLLSGHVGEGNQLTSTIANMIGATPIITTASDVEGKLAIDVWAKTLGLKIGSREQSKEIAAAILDGEMIELQSDIFIEGNLPKELCRNDNSKGKHRVRITGEIDHSCLTLIPSIYVVGIGCRKDTKESIITQTIKEVFRQNQLDMRGIYACSSIDVKKEEQGIIEFAENFKIPFKTYSKEKLLQLEGDFSSSDFVKKTVGVDNVCERAALYMAGNAGKLLIKKFAKDGVTVAVACRDITLNIESCIYN